MKVKRFELKADFPFAGDTWHQRTVIERISADTTDCEQLPELRQPHLQVGSYCSGSLARQRLGGQRIATRKSRDYE